jgi:hypothetical protein
MKKQTAVEWLVEKLDNVRPTQICSIETIKEWCNQAKAMEKEQIKYAFGQGSLFDPVFPDQFHYRAEDYYQYHYEHDPSPLPGEFHQ